MIAPTQPRVVLIGAPGAGKSTVGPLLADLLGVGFRDTDADVALAAGKSVPEVFVEDGEPRFRELERDAVLTALDAHDGVLAVGGGAVLDADSRTALARYRSGGGAIVWLQVTLASAAGRVGFNQPRPVLLGNPRAQWQALLEQRRPVYSELAAHAVDTDRVPPQEVAARIVARLEGNDD
ncbi:shikimate kinase [Cellulomonas sp. NPDC089187]|uniref:shikimate kinase n=1 Tax=Cellulomonas sp. NPDC089187 TaxID=3154970 RepID=UPI00343CD65A